MSRNGKIARLPAGIRGEINQRLRDGQNGRDIIAWLNASEEVRAVLAGEFGGKEISDENLSAWRNGGYRDWEMMESALDETRRIVNEGRELEMAADMALADRLAVWLVGRYIMLTRKLVENQDDPEAWKRLRELCHDLVALRRGDHGAGWLHLHRERLELLRRRHKREENAARAKSGDEAAPPNPAKPAMSEDEQELAWRQIFGMEPV